MVRTGVFVCACREYAADSGSCHREMKHVLFRRPNAGPQARRWQLPGTPRLTARDAHEKRGRFRAAPAASLAGHVGPRAKKMMPPFVVFDGGDARFHVQRYHH